MSCCWKNDKNTTNLLGILNLKNIINRWKVRVNKTSIEPHLFIAEIISQLGRARKFSFTK